LIPTISIQNKVLLLYIWGRHLGLSGKSHRGWGKVFMEELRGLHPSPSIVKVIRLRYMRGVGHAARKEN